MRPTGPPPLPPAIARLGAATAKTLEHQAKAMDSQVAFFQIAAGHDAGISRAVPPQTAPRAAMAMAKPVPVTKKSATAKAAPVQRMSANVGPARRMQTALASAVNADDWKEF